MTASTVRAIAPASGSPQLNALGLLLRALASSGWVAFLLLPPTLLAVLFGGRLERDAGRYLQVSAALALPLVALVTSTVVTAAARPLAFMKVLPLRRAAKWLVLLPVCALVLALVTLSAVLQRMSFPAALTLLGCGGWAVAVGHWVAGRRLRWMALATPICWLAPVAAKVAFAMGGWWLAAAVSLAVSLSGLLATRDRTGDVLSWSTGHARGQRPIEPAGGTFRAPARPRKPGLLRFVSQAWLLSLPLLGLIVMLSVNIPLALLFVVVNRLPVMSFFWVMLIPPLAGLMTQARSPQALEFLGTRPLRRGWLAAGTIVPWALIALLVPLSALLRLSSGGLSRGLESAGTFTLADQTRYLREVVGAHWLSAEAATSHPFPPEVWTSLQPLLYQHVLRLALVTLASIFAFSSFTAVSSRRLAGGATGRADVIARGARLILLVVTGAAVVMCSQLNSLWHHRLVPIPIWLCGILAVAGAASLRLPSAARK